MTKAERKLIDFIHAHLPLLAVLCFTALALLARLTGRFVVTVDYTRFLSGWYEAIAAAPFGKLVGNYTTPYMTAMFVMTRLSFLSPMTAIKLFSILFDFLLALVSGSLVKLLTGSKNKAAVSYCIILMMPTVITNSAYWGQCDAILAFLIVSFFLLFLKRKYLPAFVVYGLAMSFKLQAIFFLPYIITAYFRRKDFSLLHFLIIPAMLVLTALPYTVAAGVSPLYNFNIFLGLSGDHTSLSLFSPGFAQLLLAQTSLWFDLCMLLAVGVLGFGLWRSLVMGMKKPASDFDELQQLTWFGWAAVLFMPAMHDRYGFVCGILLVLCAICQPTQRRIALAAITEAVYMRVYVEYFYICTHLDQWAIFENEQVILSVVLLVAFLVFSCTVFSHAKEPQTTLEE
ncbi:MAG: hypothetical protein Q4C54_07820 [Clostridia bacterium]|nr:hypothetical protein [Clostridia bacterium]